MTTQEIQDRVTGLLRERFDIPPARLTPENLSRPLTGEVFRFMAYDMVELFMEVQALFGVSIDMNDPRNTHRFDTVEHITEIIAEQMTGEIAG